jgi:hypothetical protein
VYNYDANSYNEAYQRASRKVREKMEFYQSLVVYIFVNALLIGIYLVTSWNSGWYGHPWFAWVLGFWGLGLTVKAVRIFAFDNVDEQRMIQNEMYRMNSQPPANYPIPPAQYDKK